MTITTPQLPSVTALHAEMQNLRRIALLIVTLGGLIVSVLGLLVIAGRPESRELNLAIQGVLVFLLACAGVRALIPDRAAYRHAAAILCWAFTLSFSLRAVSLFILGSSEWIGRGHTVPFAAWIPVVLLCNFLFLPLRHALTASGMLYLVTAGCVLVATHRSVAAGALPPNLLAMLLFFVFAGVPICIGVLAVMSYVRSRFESLTMELETAIIQERRSGEIDDVTGCMNRRGLTRILNRELAGTVTTAQGLLAAVEPSNFARHLQILGGAGSHAFLVTLGRCIREYAGKTATVARWDAGRFYVYLPSLADIEPRVWVNGLLSVLLALPPVASGALSVCIGACIITPASKTSDLLEEVDLRLFLAQSSGGNRIMLETEEVR